MKGFIPKAQVEKMLQQFQEDLRESLLDSIEEPLDYPGAAEFLSCSEKTLRNKVALRQIPFHKQGKVYFYKSELNYWIKNNRGIFE